MMYTCAPSLSVYIYIYIHIYAYIHMRERGGAGTPKHYFIKWYVFSTLARLKRDARACHGEQENRTDSKDYDN